MATLHQASAQWASRPDDERYLNLDDMFDAARFHHDHARRIVAPSKSFRFLPGDDHKAIALAGAKDIHYNPTHWSFGQLAALAEAPAGWLRTMPADFVADALNYSFRFKRSAEDVGLLLYADGEREVQAANGPNYGTIWDDDIIATLRERFGNGTDGDWKVPGEFGKRVPITKANTTLYASDRDMFVFLADEDHRIEIPNRRAGLMGSMARGFFLWNSMVGSKTLGIGTFLFDYACCNRIVWGAEAYKEIRIRHTVSAPGRWIDEVQPVLLSYSHGSAKPVQDAIVAAQAKKVDDLDEFLAARFGKRLVAPLQKVHEIEEGRPIETLWDITTAATAYARGINHIDARVEIERAAGDLLKLAA